MHGKRGPRGRPARAKIHPIPLEYLHLLTCIPDKIVNINHKYDIFHMILTKTREQVNLPLMATTRLMKNRIHSLKREYDTLRKGKDSLLSMIDEVEIAESVYNSNAIENSTLSLEETERILLEQILSRNVSIREVYEAKNLARVIEYKRIAAKDSELSETLILQFHQMLMGGIDDSIAGRFRRRGEYVRVGTHIAPAPEHVERMMENLLVDYVSDLDAYFLDKIALFHLDFEYIHSVMETADWDGSS